MALGSFSSLYELSVALNFAYVASDSIRELFKRGFLSTTRQLSTKLDKKIEDISVRLTLLNDSLLPPEKKEKVSFSLSLYLKTMKDFDEKLDDRIQEAQELTQNKLKSLYVISALYGILMLFFAGVESNTTRFPYNELITLSFFTSALIGTITFYSFKRRYPPLFSMIITMFMIIIISVFFPFSHSKELYKIPENYLTYVTIVISLSPFIISTIRLALSTLFVEMQGWFLFYIFSFLLWNTNRKLKNIEAVENYF